MVVRLRLALAVALALSFAATSGCAHVRPWEREDLARIEKQLDGHESSRSYESHMWMVREGSLGGSGQPGGGCGCN